MIQFSIPFKLRVSLVLVIGIALLKTSVWWALAYYSVIAFFWVITLKPPLKIISKLLGAELILLSLLKSQFYGNSFYGMFTNNE